MKSRTWYLSETGFPCNSYCVPGNEMTESQKTEALHILNQARNLIGNRFGGYRVEVQIPETGERIVARGHRVQTDGAIYHVLREIPQIIPELSLPELAYEPWLYRVLLDPNWVYGGMVLIAGSAGSGKSTTMAATMVSRLKTFGGLGITLEDPPEYSIQGQHNRGVCMQFPAADQSDFPDLMLDALRCYPAGLHGSILLVGEIRSPEVASLVVESALGGHLVLTTIHAMSPESALSRLCTLAGQINGVETARADVAESLRAVIYQRMMNGRPQMQALVNETNSGSIPAKIRDGQFHHLNADIMRQKVLLQQGRSPTGL